MSGGEQLREIALACLIEESAPAGLTLSDLAKSMRVGASTLLPHLRALVEEGRIERRRVPNSRRPRYVPRDYLAVTWVWPEKGILAKWTSQGTVSWRYPLVSRILDQAAQRSLLQFLRACDSKGLFAGAAEPPNGGRTFGPVGVSVIVYGSHARGEARPSSDVDVLVVGSINKARVKALKGVAAEANLWTKPRLDVRVMTTNEFSSEARDPFFENVLDDGLTVFTNDEDTGYIESIRPTVILPHD